VTRRFGDVVSAIGVLVATLALSAPAAAEPRACGAEGHPWIRLDDAHPPSFDAASWAEVVTQLRTALAARFIDLCGPTEGGESQPLATLSMGTTEGDSVRITVLVKDEVTDKRVARDVDLASIPNDGRPLTVALAADELLRASWAEVNLVGAPPLVRPVPREVTEAIAIDPDRLPSGARARRFFVGVGGAAEHFTGGYDQAGADASVRALFHPRFGVELGAGLRSAFVRDAPDGRVHGSAVVVAVGPMARLLALPRLSLDLVARFRVTAVRVTAEPRSGARHYESAGTALHVTMGPMLTFEVASPLVIFIGADAGFPLRGLAITDGSDRVGGVSGVVLGSMLGLGATL
jgi:hypothetical protein